MKVGDIIKELQKLNPEKEIYFKDSFSELMLYANFRDIEELKDVDENFDPPLKKGEYIVEVCDI